MRPRHKIALSYPAAHFFTMNSICPLLVFPVLLLCSCVSSLEVLSGSSKDYASVRLIDKTPNIDTPTRYQQGQVWLRNDIQDLCNQNGLKVSSGPAELEIAHLVIIQNNITTTSLSEYFGSGLEAEALGNLAHRQGVVKSKEVEQFNRAGLVINVRETKTGKLIYRKYVKRDILPEGTPLEVRQRLVREAVIETLSPFFR
jgi:hypothetical protein